MLVSTGNGLRGKAILLFWYHLEIRVCNLQCWYQPGMVLGVKKFFCDGINLEIRVSFLPSGIFAKASNAWHVVNAWWHVAVIVLTCNLIFSLHQEEYRVA